MDILSHVLVSPNVTRVACGKNRTPLLAPDTIVVHYTGGGDARSSALYLADPATKASAHVVIARDGQVFQLVPFNVRHGLWSWTIRCLPNTLLQSGLI